MNSSILEVRNLTVQFKKKRKLLETLNLELTRKKALDSVSFNVIQGETFGIVGETGSGKTTLARSMVGVYRPKNCYMKLLGKEIDLKKRTDILFLRKNIGMVFQDPVGSLNPKLRVIEIIAEGIASESKLSKKERKDRISDAVSFVDLPESKLESYPTELSGGEKQRVSLARSIMGEKKLVILDEPTSSLDVSIQAQILNLLTKLKNELSVTYILITHDLNVIKYMCDRVAVLYYGQILEVGPTRELFERPRHPYTSDLVNANVTLSSTSVFSEKIEYGEPSTEGCVYKNSCSRRFAPCDTEPPIVSIDGQLVKCWLYDKKAESKKDT